VLAETQSPKENSRQMTQELKINSKLATPLLQKAYGALLSGDLLLAQSLYQKIAKRTPRQTSALLALAVIAEQLGRADRAQEYYQRVLNYNPLNPEAQAGLLNLLALRDPDAAEDRIAFLLQRFPSKANLHFAHGGIQAMRKNWRLAQQAFLQAHRLDPLHPDNLFNLAVSSEHMQQKAKAKEYYRQALEARQKRPASFNAEVARSRLNLLEQE